MAGTARGGNAQDMKTRNRLLVLQMLCTYGPLSRGEIAARAGLSKMTATNIISDLETAGLIAEEKGESAGAGRRPGLIRLSPASPLVCGITIGRRRCEAVLADLSAQIVARESACYDNALDGPRLSELLARLCSRLLKRADRPVAGVGVAALGPLDARAGTLLNPPNFYGIGHLPVRAILSDASGLPCVLLHDVSAAALAEQLYGAGQAFESFFYLQIRDGIGADMVLDGALFDGVAGLSGELGHVSINFEGPQCACGGRGCLECYASERALLAYANEYAAKAGGTAPKCWSDAICAAGTGDAACAAALERYCGYVAAALSNALCLIDVHRVFVGYDGDGGGLLERLLEQRVNERLHIAGCRRITVRRSSFGSDASVYGAAALAARCVFDGAFALPQRV